MPHQSSRRHKMISLLTDLYAQFKGHHSTPVLETVRYLVNCRKKLTNFDESTVLEFKRELQEKISQSESIHSYSEHIAELLPEEFMLEANLKYISIFKKKFSQAMIDALFAGHQLSPSFQKFENIYFESEVDRAIFFEQVAFADQQLEIEKIIATAKTNADVLGNENSIPNENI